MKKVFGILFLLLGLGMIGLGIAALTNVETRRSSVEGYLGDELSERHRNENNEQQIAGLGLTVGGIVFFILGIVMVATKSRSQKRKEAELDSIKKWSDNNKQTTQNSSGNVNIDNLTKQAINLYNQKDYYSAITVLQRALALNPTSFQTHYNLACLYSLIQNSEAFNSLSKAVEYGYINFEKIKSHPDLEWIRKQPEYDEFVKNVYKLKVKSSDTHTSDSSKTNTANDDMYEQLERLSKLKEKGILTDEEFQQQKKKILN